MQHGRQLGLFAQAFQAEAKHRLGIDRQMSAISIEEGGHAIVANAGIGEHHEHECVDIVGMNLVWLDLAGLVLQELCLLVLVACEPGDALFEHPLGQLRVVLAGDL